MFLNLVLYFPIKTHLPNSVFLLSSQHMHILCLQKLGSWPLETWERFFWKLSRLAMSQLVLNKFQNHAAIFNHIENIINNSWRKIKEMNV